MKGSSSWRENRNRRNGMACNGGYEERIMAAIMKLKAESNENRRQRKSRKSGWRNAMRTQSKTLAWQAAQNRRKINIEIERRRRRQARRAAGGGAENGSAPAASHTHYALQSARRKAICSHPAGGRDGSWRKNEMRKYSENVNEILAYDNLRKSKKIGVMKMKWHQRK